MTSKEMLVVVEARIRFLYGAVPDPALIQSELEKWKTSAESLLPDPWQPFGEAPTEGAFMVWMEKPIHGSHAQPMRRHPNCTIVAGHFLFDLPDNRPTHWRPALEGPRG